MLYKLCLHLRSNSVYSDSLADQTIKTSSEIMIHKSFLKGLLPLHPFIHCKSWSQSKENGHVIKHNYLRCVHRCCYHNYCTLHFQPSGIHSLGLSSTCTWNVGLQKVKIKNKEQYDNTHKELHQKGFQWRNERNSRTLLEEWPWDPYILVFLGITTVSLLLKKP